MDQNNGPEAKISKKETRTLLTTDLGAVPLLLTRTFLRDLTLQMGTTIRIMEDHTINAEISTSTETIGNQSRNGSFNNRNGKWRNNERFSRSPRLHRRDFSQDSSYRQQRSDQPKNSAFRRPDN